MIKFEKAINLINDYPINLKEKTINLEDAHKKVLSENVYSPINVPHFNKSAMDGYGLNKEDLNKYKKFKCIGTIYAGDNKKITLKKGQCVKIMTGAKVPKGINIVIQQELAKKKLNKITFTKTDNLKDNICHIGEDIQKDMLLFKKGTKLNAVKLSSLKSVGIKTLKIYKNLKVLVISTGNEILNKNEQLNENENKIYNSNQTYIFNRLKELEVSNIELMHIKDKEKNFAKVINKINDYDLVITTGAISVGQKDIIRNYIKKNNKSSKLKVIFDKVNIMPGGPVVFWEYKEVPILSLAGSPFANFVTFETFGALLISKLKNDKSLQPRFEKKILKDQWNKEIKKRRFVKVLVKKDECFLNQNNHLASALFEMSFCNGLLNIDPRVKKINKNEEVEVILLGGNYE